MDKVNRSSIWVSYIICTVFLAYQYMLRVLPNNLMPVLTEKFHVGASAYGQFSGVYYIGYTLMHIPVGIILDRFGPKWILPLCMILTGLGILPPLYAEHWPEIYGSHWIYSVIGRFMMGMGSSAAVLGMFKIIKIGFGDEKFTTMLGLSVTIGLLGACYGGQPVSYLFQIFSWESVLLVLALFGFVLAIITFLTTPAQKSVDTDAMTVLKDVIGVMTNVKILGLCLLGGLMVGPLEGFADVWGKVFLLKVYAFTDNESAFLPSLIFMGMCVGATLLSYIANVTRAYYEIIFFAALLMGLAFILLLTGQMNFYVLVFLFFGIGVLCAYQILLIYKATTYASGHMISLTSACANMIIMIFGYFFHTVIGKLMESFWDGEVVDGTPVYQADDFIASLSVIPLCLLIAACFLFYIMLRHRKKARYELKMAEA